ncbi:MAG: diguanylate cyclase [Ferrovum sp.]|jgi:diguanylate cyclase (GGDEF)-like protein/PAS domain S-box-containing protein|nr:diguanylate cyclase [Ferrovum sp.]
MLNVNSGDKFLSHLLDHLFDAVITTQSDGLITSFNRAASVLFGYTVEEVMGRNVNMLIPETHRSIHDTHFCHYLDNQTSQILSIERELYGQHKDGRIFIVKITLTTYLEENSPPIFIAILHDHSQHNDTLQRLHNSAYSDSLTGLPNRLLLMDRLTQGIRSLNRESPGIALLFIDLDNFKPVNDGFGHLVGDLVLKEIAQRLLRCVRDSDTIARLGGDEFIVLLMGVETPLSALGIAEKIREEIQQSYFINPNLTLELSASLGLTYCHNPGTTAEELIRQADLAMYRAKAQGRNMTVTYTPDTE